MCTNIPNVIIIYTNTDNGLHLSFIKIHVYCDCKYLFVIDSVVSLYKNNYHYIVD